MKPRKATEQEIPEELLLIEQYESDEIHLRDDIEIYL